MTFTVEPRTRLIWAAIDLDGTLAESVWPDPGIGDPIKDNVEKLVQLYDEGYKVIIHTSRSWEAYELIESWLAHHDLLKYVSRIVCGKVLAAVYVDDRAVHAEDIDWMPEDYQQ